MAVSKSGGRFQGSRNFQVTGKDSNYLLLLTKYFDSVQNKMKELLQSNKNMNHKQAEKFMGKMVNLDNKRMKDLKGEVADDYAKGMSVKDCAQQTIDKYYNLTKVNQYKAPMEQEEVTEVSEKVTTSFYHFKQVSSSLFWNFIQRVSKLGVKFIFDTSYINKMDNTLNHKDFNLYMETPEVKDKDVEYEFTHSKLLSSILKVITSNNHEGDGIKFFIAIDKNKLMRFGYILNDKKYTFGAFKYQSSDMLKLAPHMVASNGDIDFKVLSNKFKSSMWLVWYYRSVLKVYLEQYNDVDKDSINIYISVINNKLALVVESSNNDDVLNKKYIENILQTNISDRLKKEDFYVNDIQYQGKTHYYIIIK